MTDRGRAAARFFDSRAAYMMFVTTTNEKAKVAARVGEELTALRPRPPGLRVLDAGMGDASVLSQLMRQMHQVYGHVPWLVVGKEISLEDVRQTLEKLPDRLFEHPELVFVITNMHYREAPWLRPGEPGAGMQWRNVALEGTTTQAFTEQIRRLYPRLAHDWEMTTSPRTGNPVYARPSVLVIYRRDREFVLDQLIPTEAGVDHGYDLIVASQPYRARTSLARKVRLVIVPLARALAPGGRLVAVHSYGHDPGMEIIRNVWPDEDPFDTHGHDILAEARRQLDRPEDADLEYSELSPDEALFRYDLHAMPSEVSEHIGTSSIMAAWNAAAYVAQIDEQRLDDAVGSGAYLAATREVLARHRRIWFNDEAYLITRRI